MKRSRNRIAAALSAVLAGGLAAFALRPSDKPTATLAAQHPVVDVRTQVIRRTIHVVRHQSAGHHPAPRGAVATGSPGSGQGAAAVRTGSSGAHAAGGSSAGGHGAGSGAVTTRSSGSHASAPASRPAPASFGSAPVRTRTSGSAPGSTGSSSHRSSGGGTKPVTTRSSGGPGKGGDGGDGGDGGHGHSSGD